MSATIKNDNTITISMPLNEFLTYAGFTDNPDHYTCTNGSDAVIVRIGLTRDGEDHLNNLYRQIKEVQDRTRDR